MFKPCAALTFCCCSTEFPVSCVDRGQVPHVAVGGTSHPTGP